MQRRRGEMLLEDEGAGVVRETAGTRGREGLRLRCGSGKALAGSRLLGVEDAQRHQRWRGGDAPCSLPSLASAGAAGKRVALAWRPRQTLWAVCAGGWRHHCPQTWSTRVAGAGDTHGYQARPRPSRGTQGTGHNTGWGGSLSVPWNSVFSGLAEGPGVCHLHAPLTSPPSPPTFVWALLSPHSRTVLGSLSSQRPGFPWRPTSWVGEFLVWHSPGRGVGARPL